MREAVFGVNESLLHFPSKKEGWGVAIPITSSIDKDGLAILDQRDAKDAARFLHVNRLLGEYIRRWGFRTYYLGTYTNPSGGKFKLFGLPVKHKVQENYDLTLITESVPDLVQLCDRYCIKGCLLPMIGEDLTVFVNCIKPALELLLDDRFIVVHRKEKQ